MEVTDKVTSALDEAESAHLFAPLTLRSVTLRNRIMVSPMCQYSSVDGFVNDWHLVHLGSRAVGGAGLVFTEAAAVEARGRISPADLGIYREEHLPGLRRLTEFGRAQGAVIGIQLAHAGRKASTHRPWDKTPPTVPASEGGWTTVAPSPLAFSPTYPNPQALSRPEIAQVVEDFALAARRAAQAGFEVIELHAAHGYLLHQFLSPVANGRSDDYGGSLANRQRIVVEVVDAVRSEWPDSLPLFVRLSATDWLEGQSQPGWRLEDTLELTRTLSTHGVDVVDVSSGGLSPAQKITVGPGYQVPFAERIRRETGLRTAAVGMITEPAQADAIIREGQADLVALARELLRNPYWPQRAARELGQPLDWPLQYERAKL